MHSEVSGVRSWTDFVRHEACHVRLRRAMSGLCDLLCDMFGVRHKCFTSYLQASGIRPCEVWGGRCRVSGLKHKACGVKRDVWCMGGRRQVCRQNVYRVGCLASGVGCEASCVLYEVSGVKFRA